jgi:transcriptional regulator with XRE-family HTH domain
VTTELERLTTTPEGKRLLAQERLILDVTEFIIGLMQEQDVTRAELAKRLGRSKGWISQLLAGEANFTLRTLADVFGALGYHPRIDVERYGDGTPKHSLPTETLAGPVMWRTFSWTPKFTPSAEDRITDSSLAG